jgi:hypothetical protein
MIAMKENIILRYKKNPVLARLFSIICHELFVLIDRNFNGIALSEIDS